MPRLTPPPPRPNPRLDNIERRGSEGEGALLFTAVLVLGVWLIVMLLASVRW